MTGLVALLATLILFAAHWLARGRPPSSPAPALRVFVPAALATWLLTHLGGWPELAAIRLPLTLFALLTALAAWVAMTTLFAMGARKRDAAPRIGLLLPAAILMAGGASSGISLLGILGTCAWR